LILKLERLLGIKKQTKSRFSPLDTLNISIIIIEKMMSINKIDMFAIKMGLVKNGR